MAFDRAVCREPAFAVIPVSRRTLLCTRQYFFRCLCQRFILSVRFLLGNRICLIRDLLFVFMENNSPFLIYNISVACFSECNLPDLFIDISYQVNNIYGADDLFMIVNRRA